MSLIVAIILALVALTAVLLVCEAWSEGERQVDRMVRIALRDKDGGTSND